MELPPFNFPNPLGYFGGKKQVSDFSFFFEKDFYVIWEKNDEFKVHYASFLNEWYI